VTVTAAGSTQNDAPSAAASVPTEPSESAELAEVVVVNRATELWQAAETGDMPALKSLLDKRIDINSRDDNGRTALMLATLHGQTRAVKMLLAHGADPNAADADGTTPLQAALAAHQGAIAATLRRAGAR
jgi:ankyrin repeat protein